MGDETKDTSPDQGDEPSDIKQSAKDQSDKSHPAGTVGADVPEKAKPLPPEAGSLSPAQEIEAKTKAEQPAGETLRTEAKVEVALPGVEKPSMTPTVEGATTAGEPPKKVDTEAAEKPAPPRAAPKAPPAAGHKPAPPPKKGPTITVDITGDPLIDRIRKQFGEAITEAVATLGQQIIRVKKESFFLLCTYLHDDQEALFDMCTDLTAVHWPDRSGQEFEVVILLYSVPKNRRLRVKVSLADGEECPSVTSIWSGANWMERETYDMFGLRFEGHPDLRRILLPEDWPGHPLRKEYPIEYRDNEWTDKHLDYREIDYDTSVIDVKYGERR